MRNKIFFFLPRNNNDTKVFGSKGNFSLFFNFCSSYERYMRYSHVFDGRLPAKAWLDSLTRFKNNWRRLIGKRNECSTSSVNLDHDNICLHWSRSLSKIDILLPEWRMTLLWRCHKICGSLDSCALSNSLTVDYRRLEK